MIGKRIYFIAIVLLLSLSACAANSGEDAASMLTESTGEGATEQDQAQPTPQVQGTSEERMEVNDQADAIVQDTESMTEDDAGNETVVDRPGWQSLPVTNVRTGESFTLADFAGKTIFVETMATWCSNCRRQLNNVRDAKWQVDESEVVFVALSVETNIDDDELASYAKGNSFDWVFAVASAEMLQSLTDEFGRAILNPPATPHFLIRADGSFTELVTGIDPPGEILAQLSAATG